MSDDPEFEASLRGYRRRWRIINALLAIAVVVGLWQAWARLLRTPSPATICAHLWALRSDDDVPADEAKRRRGMLDRVSGGLADMANPEARHAEACAAYFGAIDGELEWHRWGALGRCLLASELATEVRACFEGVDTEGGREALARIVAGNTEFPSRRPDLPEVVAPHYDELLAISERALEGCPAIFDKDDGCYTYTWDGVIEERRALAHAIPSAPGVLGGELVALEASCEYDARAWAERYPRLVESARAFPFPVQRFVCNYLAQGQPHSLGGCSTRKPYGDDAQVGVEDNQASVSIPYDPECEGQWVHVTIERHRGDVGVEVTALFRGPAWDPAISTAFAMPEELEGVEEEE